MNKYLKNLNRIEFLVTMDCTGNCIHCSEGEHKFTGVHIDKDLSYIIYDIKKEYNITSVMAFGGEALMYPETVFSIFRVAKDSDIPKRQLITNGFFTKNKNYIKSVVSELKLSGVNDLLLSVDAFHQNTIPIESVLEFAFLCKNAELDIKTNPAWLESKNSLNSYNKATLEILSEFKKMGIKEGEGNIVFPWGRAKENLKEFFFNDKEYINQLKGYKSYIESKTNKQVNIYLYSIISATYKKN